MSTLYRPKIIETPLLIGKTIQEAMRITSQKNLSIKLFDEKEDPELPAGTIISQTPAANCPIKANQSMNVVVSKKTGRKAPCLVGKNLDIIQQEMKSQGLTCTYYEIAGKQPTQLCIAQDPAPGALMSDRAIAVYICKGAQEPYLFPNFGNKHVDVVRNFLANYPVTLEIIHSQEVLEEHNCSTCVVLEQRPRAGSMVVLDPQKPVHVQLRVAPIS